MEIALTFANLALPVLYVVCLALYAGHFFDESDTDAFRGSTLLYATLGFHATYLLGLGLHGAHFPLATASEFFSLLSLSVGVTYALAERRHREANTGMFFLAIVFLFQLASTWLTADPGTVPDRLQNPVYGIHVVLTVFGFAGLTVSSLYALMYILLNRQLKSRNLGVIFRQLPPLNTLENMSKVATTSGVVLLGLGLALGHWVAFQKFSVLELFQQPLIVVADVAWIGYLAGLLLARTRRLTGVRFGYASVGGYLVFMTSMVVVLATAGTFHTFP